MKRLSWDSLIARYPALFALILFIIAVAVNFFLQPEMFARDTLNSNMRVFLPLMLLAVGQAIVILGGGIDISVGSIVAVVNTVLATRVGLEGNAGAMWLYVGASILIGILAGAINGFLHCLSAPAANHHHLCNQFSLRWFGFVHPSKSRRRYPCANRQTLSQYYTIWTAAGILCYPHQS